MTRRRPGPWIATLALLAVVTACVLVTRPQPAAADLRSLVAPGKLARAHSKLESKCDSCHVPFKGIPDTACLACHDKTQARIDKGRGPHAVYAREGRKCTSCHGDHKGPDHAITPAVDKSFDHRVTGFPLEAAHARAACEKCHPSRNGSTRWADLPRDCAGCHQRDDTHKGALGTACAACHSEQGWKTIQHGRGEHKVSLSGAHANLDCRKCHEGGGHLSPRWSCADCHNQPHGGTKAPCATCHVPESWKKASFTHDFCTCFLPGKHQTADCLGCHPAFKFSPTPMDCAGCHKKDLKHEPLGPCSRCHSALSFKTKVFDHDKPAVGFQLKDRHFEVGCENCHTKKGIFRGTPRQCEGCHKDPGHGDFGPCAACHSEKGFLEVKFSHGTTRFPLDGVHAELPCQECHAPERGKLKKGVFVPGPNACVLCHQSPHRGQFGSLSPRGKVMLAAGAGADHVVSPRFGCRDCHQPKAWKPTTIDADRHARFGFTLLGGHQKVACARCHEGGQYAGTPNDCTSCHLDRHAGSFGNECTRCHEESGWRNHPPLDHRAETGFALEGSHVGPPCAACHGETGADLRTRAPVTCATCHVTTGPRGHGSQFGSDCTACHQPSRFSEVPPFNHAATHFPLERRHLALACTRCHTATQRRASPDCRSCHGDPHRGRATLDCSDCHRPDDWKILRFDHDRSEFPLNGRHFLTPCRDCHVGNVFSGLRRDCIFCHRGDRARIDAKDPGHRMMPFSCGDPGCHIAFTWRK